MNRFADPEARQLYSVSRVNSLKQGLLNSGRCCDPIIIIIIIIINFHQKRHRRTSQLPRCGGKPLPRNAVTPKRWPMASIHDTVSGILMVKVCKVFQSIKELSVPEPQASSIRGSKCKLWPYAPVRFVPRCPNNKCRRACRLRVWVHSLALALSATP